MTDPTDDTRQIQEKPTRVDHRKRNMWLMLLGITFAVIAIVYFLYWLIWGRFDLYTNDAYVNGNIIQLMPQINGTIIGIHTDNTHLVIAGQPLIELDKTDTVIALQKAKANLAQTVRQVREYYENAARAENALLLRQADLLKASLDVHRRQGLVGAKAISREEMQHYLTALAAAKAQYNIANHNLRTALALVDHTHLYTHPLVQNAKALLRQAYLNADRTTIYAPVTGYVANRTVQLGQSVGIATPLLSIVPLSQVWVDANYKESQLEDIRIGQPVSMYADAYPDFTFHGKIIGLTPGTGTTFSLLPPQNATGNWIKILQRLPVRIRLDQDDLKKYPLMIGLSMNVTTHINDTSGKRLATVNQPAINYVTTTYAKQLAGVQALINTILHKNGPDVAFTSYLSLSKGPA